MSTDRIVYPRTFAGLAVAHKAFAGAAGGYNQPVHEGLNFSGVLHAFDSAALYWVSQWNIGTDF